MSSTIAPTRHGLRRVSELAARVPPWMHLTPYLSLALLGGVLAMPGVVPVGPACGSGDAPARGVHAFIALSAIGFGLVALLLLISALLASAQRLAGRPGWPTVICAAGFAAITLAAVISPRGTASQPAQMVMILDVVALLGTTGLAPVILLVALLILGRKLPGPGLARGAQISAWTVLLVGLPLIMAWVYLTVTPICMD